MDGSSRYAANEALFRAVNERIAEAGAPRAEGDGDMAEHFEFLCDCGDQDCIEKVSLALAEYEEVRAGATQFVVAPGHERPGVETILEENERFVLVRKEVGADFLESTDPRS